MNSIKGLYFHQWFIGFIVFVIYLCKQCLFGTSYYNNSDQDSNNHTSSGSESIK